MKNLVVENTSVFIKTGTGTINKETMELVDDIEIITLNQPCKYKELWRMLLQLVVENHIVHIHRFLDGQSKVCLKIRNRKREYKCKLEHIDPSSEYFITEYFVLKELNDLDALYKTSEN